MIKVTLHGNLTVDPVFQTYNNTEVLRFTVAARTMEKGSDGNYISNFFDVSIWGKRAQYLQNQLQKGTHVVVAGELAVVPYTDKSGAQRTRMRINATDVDAVARTKDDTQPRAAAPAPRTQATQEEDELPF